MGKFGTASELNLLGVDPRLVKLHRAVVAFFDHAVDDGCRTIREQTKNVAKGVSQTMDSKHLVQADGLCHATDSMPWPRIDWAKVEKALNAVKAVDSKLDLLRFYHFQGVMLGAAAMLGIDLRQGLDWNENNDPSDQKFFDLPHNETKV